MPDQLRVVMAVARDRTLARIELAFVGYTMAEQATWVAIVVWAYGIGGAGFAGLTAVIQLVPAGLVAPFAAYAGDRFRHDRVLLVGYAIQAASLAGTAIALYGGAPIPVTLAVAAAAAVAMTLTRPAQSVILPIITHSPADLTAANAVSGLAESVGLFLGPLVAGAVLIGAQPADIFAAFALWSVANVILVSRLRVQHVHTDASPGPGATLRAAFGGFDAVRRDAAVLSIVILLTFAMVVWGALDILFVAVAIDLFGAGESWAGFLVAGFGLGAIAGAFASVALIGRRRLTPAFAGAVVLYGLALTFVAVLPSIGPAAAALAAAGAALAVGGVAGRTLLQRVAPEAILGRVFGVVEGLGMFALAVGSLAASLLIEAFDVRTALMITGLSVPAVAIVMWPVLGAIDHGARPPDPRALALLRTLPIFAPLSAPPMERILAELTWIDARAGDVLIREGDAGDRFYVLAEGRVEVTQRGAILGERGPGAGLGEIALLRDVPRTATVTALTPLRLLAIERARFLEAVTGHFQSHREAEAMASAHLAHVELPAD